MGPRCARCGGKPRRSGRRWLRVREDSHDIPVFDPAGTVACRNFRHTVSHGRRPRSRPPHAGAAPTPPRSWAPGSTDRRRRHEARAGRAAADSGRRRQAGGRCRQAEGPKGFKVEVYAGGVPNARSLREGDKGTVFVGSRLQDKVHALVDKGGKREVKVIAVGPSSSERAGLQGRHALHRRAVEDLQDREDRGQSRQSAEADGDLRRPAEGRAARLEIHRHRAGQQALYSGRPALQQLPAARHAWADPPHQSRRQRHGGDRARRAQHGRLRLASGVEAALFHRQRTRLGVGRSARGRAQPHHQGR